MANDILQFDIAQLQSDHSDAVKYQQAYAQALSDLKSEIEKISGFWTTGSTGLWDQFKGKYDEKAKVLEDANQLITELCQTFQSKIDGYNEAATTVAGLFQ